MYQIVYTDLRWNELGASGGAAVVTLLQSNRVLTDVRLTGNGIPPETLRQVEKLLERNKSELLRRGTQSSLAEPTKKVGCWVLQ